MDNMRYKADLEWILTLALKEREPLLSQVLISDDGEFAIVQVAAKCTRRKLTPIGKEFIHTGVVGKWFSGEGEKTYLQNFWRLVLEDAELPC